VLRYHIVTKPINLLPYNLSFVLGDAINGAWMPRSEDDCCRVCRSYLALIGSQQSPSEEINFHNMRQLIDSAGDGCHLCSLILSEISPDQQQKYLEELDSKEEDEPQIVAFVWYFKSPDERRPPVPHLGISEAKYRPGAISQVRICELQCEILDDDRQMCIYNPPLLPTCTYKVFTRPTSEARTAIYRV